MKHKNNISIEEELNKLLYLEKQKQIISRLSSKDNPKELQIGLEIVLKYVEGFYNKQLKYIQKLIPQYL